MKGSMLDLFLVFIILFVIGIVAYVAMFVMSIGTSILSSTGLTNPTSTAINNSGNTFVSWWDYLLPFLGIGIGLSSIALAYFFPSHPLFFGLIGVMMIFIGLLVMPIISNTFDSFTTANGGALAAFSHLNFFIDQSPLIYTVMGIFMMVVVFTKSRLGGGE